MFQTAFVNPDLVRMAGRAWIIFVHQALGTSTIALFLGAIGYVLFWLLRRRRHLTDLQWRLEMKDTWDASGKYWFFATAGIYLLAFSICLWVAIKEKPVFTNQQIADYGYSIVVAITDPETNQADPVKIFRTNGVEIVAHSSEPSKQPIRVKGAGFWITTNGCICTCVPVAITNGSMVGVARPLITSEEGNLFRVYEGCMVHKAFITGGDEINKTRFFYVLLNPFERKDHFTMEASSGRVTQTIQIEKYSIPKQNKSRIDVGDSVFMVACEPNAEGGIVIRLIQGSVESVPHELIRDQWVARIKTSIPFKSHYVGCPVLNLSKELVGIVGNYTNDTTIIPSEYVYGVLGQTTKVIVK